MSDLISRQAAIDALERIFDRCEEIEAHLPEGDPDRTGYRMYPDFLTVWKYLHQLTSAAPNTDEEIQKMQDMEQAQLKKAFELGREDAKAEIIRCKDCKHWDTTWESDRAKNYHYCPFIDGTSTGDWYCADAERRTDE